MSHFGNIKSYDSGNKTGTIVPDEGGDVLSFRKSDLHQESQKPKQNQRYGYDVKNTANGKRFAINLRQQSEAQIQQEQARNQWG